MSALRHPNLVRLLGYCSEHAPEREVVEQVLVYELVPNRDLKRFLEQSESRWLSASCCLMHSRCDLATLATEVVEYYTPGVGARKPLHSRSRYQETSTLVV